MNKADTLESYNNHALLYDLLQAVDLIKASNKSLALRLEDHAHKYNGMRTAKARLINGAWTNDY